MNKLYFEGESVNLYGEDYKYLQDSVSEEIAKVLKNMIETGSESSIISGFNLEISPSDSTKLLVSHDGGTGSLLSKSGVIIETNSSIDRISLSDYTLDTINYVYVKIDTVLATYDRKNQVMVYERRAIDFANYQKNYNRQVDTHEVVVYTLAEWTALTQTEKDKHVYLGSTTGQGTGQPLTSVDLTGRIYMTLKLGDNTIEVRHLSPTFMLPQTKVEPTPSVSIDDEYYGTPSDILDDLNKIRTMIKDIKGTQHWDDTSAGIIASIPEINDLFKVGVFRAVDDELEILVTSSGTAVTISAGAALMGEEYRKYYEAIPLLLPLNTENYVGNWITRENGEVHFIGPQPYTVVLDEAVGGGVRIDEVHVVRTSDPTIVYIENFDYTIDEETGSLSTLVGGSISNTSITVFYKWGAPRIDVVTIGDTGLQIVQGTPGSQPTPPSITTGNIPLWFLNRKALVHTIEETDIVDGRITRSDLRECTELPANRITQYDDLGTFHDRHFWSTHRFAVIDTSTGELLVKSDKWDVVTVESYANILEVQPGATIQTILHTQYDDEVWGMFFLSSSSGEIQLKIDYEEVSNSNVFNKTVTTTIPTRINTAITPAPILLEKGFTKGFHKLRITTTSGTFQLQKILVGKLDFYYQKDNAVFKNIRVGTIDADALSTTSISIPWTANASYYTGNLAIRSDNLYQCVYSHTSSTDFFQDLNEGYWTVVGVKNSSFETLTNQVVDLQNKVDVQEKYLTELNLTVSYLTGKAIASSNLFMELFLDRTKTDVTYEDGGNNVVDLMIDTDFGDNWYLRSSGTPIYKNGAIRNKYQYYKLEWVDEFDLGSFETHGAVGQRYKAAWSRYDSNNSCYWMISHTGTNAIGEITKISPYMVDGKVQVLGRWYLPAPGASTYWSGIDVDIDRRYLYLVIHGTGSAGGVVALKINNTGTLGLKSTQSSGSFTKPTNWTDINGTSTYDWSAWWACDTNYIPTDVTVWNSSNIAVLAGDSTGTYPIKLIMVGRTIVLGSFSPNTVQDVTGLEKFLVGSSAFDFGSVIRQDDQLWIKHVYNTDGRRLVFYAEVSSCIQSDVLIRCLGEFNTLESCGRDGIAAEGNNGITLSPDGYLLEVHSTASNGKVVIKRALKNALWGENQIRDYIPLTTVNTHLRACQWDNEDSKYLWYSNNNNVSNSVRIYRRNTETGAETYTTISWSGGTWTYVFDFTFATVNDVHYVYILGYSGTYVAYVLPKTILVSALGTTLDMSAQGTAFASFETAKVQEALCTDDSYLYILNDSDDAIDKWSLGGDSSHTPLEVGYEPAKVTDNYITLMSLTGNVCWRGIDYNEDKFYIVEGNVTDNGKLKIWAISSTPRTGGATPTWFVEHQYVQGSFLNSLSYTSICIKDNILYGIMRNVGAATGISILDDPDVLQLQAYIHPTCGAIKSNPYMTTPIIQRRREPEDFTDAANMVDSMYMGVGYRGGASGFSLLMLDEYYNGKSITGKDRYDVKKIRALHCTSGTNNIITSTSGDCRIEIQDEIVIVSQYGQYLFYIDLLDNTILRINTSTTYYYNGTFSQRNEGKGWVETTDTELTPASVVFIVLSSRKFTKEDVSGYNKENPETYFLLSGNDGNGTDLLKVEYTPEGKRIPSKMYTNIFGSTSICRAGWICPFGTVFSVSSGTSYALTYSKIPVWLASRDDAFQYNDLVRGAQTASGIWGVAMHISKNSRAWKTANGTIRHQLFVSSLDQSDDGGSSTVHVLDIENWSALAISYQTAAYWLQSSVSNYEENVWATRGHYSTNTPLYAINRYKHMRFYGRSSALLYNMWTIRELIIPTTSNRTLASSNGITGGVYDSVYSILNYSPEVSTLAIGVQGWGIQLFFYPVTDQCKHQSTEIDLENNPYEVQYTQNGIFPGQE